MKRIVVVTSFLSLLLAASSRAETKVIELTIKAGKHDYQNEPVCVPLTLPKSFSKAEQVVLEVKNGMLMGQLTAPSLTTESIKPAAPGQVRRDLHFIVPHLKAGETQKFSCTIKSERWVKLDRGFIWQDKEGEYSELLFGFYNKNSKPRPVLRYMKMKYDPSSTKARNKTYKVFHHLYDPKGKRFVTNGGHADTDVTTKLLYPHHRGLMFGFHNITYDKNKKADTWHCPVKGPKQAHVEHVKTLNEEAGPVLGRHRVLIDWYGHGSDIFAKEEREVTVYAVPGGTLVEWSSRLKTTDGLVILDGDPQHAGFQFRAHNDVSAKTAKQTYYLRVGGKGKPGGTINWNKNNPPKGTVDVPWKAMSFVLGGQRYTVAYLDNPKNPGEARYSERNYGRFGYYFVYNLTKENPLLVNYRIWLEEGEMTIPQVRHLYTEFVHPPRVMVKE